MNILHAEPSTVFVAPPGERRKFICSRLWSYRANVRAEHKEEGDTHVCKLMICLDLDFFYFFPPAHASPLHADNEKLIEYSLSS
jgi:hypothetical protein